MVKVVSTQPTSGGSLGILWSPSMADALPEATDMVGWVLIGPQALQGQQIRLRLPGIEARKLAVGQPAALGLIGGDHICICVAAAPVQEDAASRRWLDAWKCPA